MTDLMTQRKAIDAALDYFNWFRNYQELGVDVIVEILTNSEVRNKRPDFTSLKHIID